MPARERVQALAAMVEAGKFVEAIEQFFTEDATMQENNAPPRGPRDRLVAHERGVLAHQRWRGDRIAEERFFYDPAQIRM
jgi:hypothetical protein